MTRTPLVTAPAVSAGDLAVEWAVGLVAEATSVLAASAAVPAVTEAVTEAEVERARDVAVSRDGLLSSSLIEEGGWDRAIRPLLSG